jgi:cardiolipin synthase
LAAPVIGWLVLSDRIWPALIAGIGAGISDWADGYLARRLSVITTTGTYLDPAADKVLLFTVFVCLGFAGRIPAWLVVLVIARDLVIVVGVVLLWKIRHRTRFTPLLSGKISTFFQIATVLVVLVESVLQTSPVRELKLFVLAATTFFTALSGLNYVRRGIRMASPRYEIS